MRFEWDVEKEKVNLKKHGLSFTEAAFVFADAKTIYLPDPDHSIGEERLVALGKVRDLTIAVVIFVDKSKNDEEIIRIVSARKATKSEEQQYYSSEID
ncbi:BrnT family toxin [Leptospira venezuelensis]|uniref:BrnT family toxin n=1 Tax=Leptospira venezuelensis TaxID=1958811 RepID=UPI000A3B49EF|nr:BrnT family toxin [Leptospira venezuelensis]